MNRIEKIELLLKYRRVFTVSMWGTFGVYILIISLWYFKVGNWWLAILIIYIIGSFVISHSQLKIEKEIEKELFREVEIENPEEK